MWLKSLPARQNRSPMADQEIVNRKYDTAAHATQGLRAVSSGGSFRKRWHT